MEKGGNLRARSVCRPGERFSFVPYITLQEIAQVHTERVQTKSDRLRSGDAGRAMREPDAD